MTQALIIDNGIEGLKALFKSNEKIHYDFVTTGKDFDLDLEGYDLFIAPNGTDNIALFRVKDKIKAFLDAGGTLFCFDGWFTDWIPGNRWIMDNSTKSIDMRYILGDDPDGISKQFSIADLNFSQGISGWWSCGYIEAAEGAQVLIKDTWDRALLVIDRVSTNGTIVMTASGPLADFSYATTDDDGSSPAMAELYQALLTLVPTKIATK